MATASLDVISGLAGGSGFKSPCVAATTGNVSLSGLSAIDGYTPSAGDRILVWQQTNPVENGIWNAATGAWTRAIDCDGYRDVFTGTQVAVANGTTYAGVSFMVTTANPITVGTSSLAFAQSLFSYITSFDLISEAQAATIAGSIKTIATGGYVSIGIGASFYKRVPAMPATAGGWFRSADRYLHDGTVDATNGGYWEDCNPVTELTAFGALGDGSTDDTTARNNWWEFAKAKQRSAHAPKGTYKITSQLDFDLAGTPATTGIVVYGDGRQNTIFDVSSVAASPQARIFCSGGTVGVPAVQANASFMDFGITGSKASGIVLAIGQSDYSDYMNQNHFEITVTSAVNGAALIGVQWNACYSNVGRINFVAGGSIIAGSIGQQFRKCAFNKLKIGGANVTYGMHITHDFTYGNTFEVPDLEVVTYSVLIDVATATNNVWNGGTFGFSDYGVKATAGSNNWFFNPNVNSSAPMFKSGADGVGVMVIGGGGNAQTQLAAPTTGQTVTINELTPALFIAAAGTLASLTINLPDNPADGQTVSITTLYELSSLSIVATPHSVTLYGTTMPAGGSITYKFYAGVATWYPVTKSPLLQRGVPITKTGDFTLAANENWLIIDKGSTCTITLPAASSYPGREIMLKTIQAFTVVSASSNVVPLVGGAASTAILPGTDGAHCCLVSDGSNWIIMSSGV